MADNLSSPEQLSQRFYFLDSLRGICALYITIYHFYSILKEKSEFIFPPIVDGIIGQATAGLRVFYILSGFVIAYSIYNKEITISFFNRFILRRSIRLDPPYWVTLIATLLISLLSIIFFTKPMETFPSWQIIMANSLYLQDFLSMERIVHVSWTLCIELQLYLFFVAIIGLLIWVEKNRSVAQREKKFDAPIFLIPLGALFLISLWQNVSAQMFIKGLFLPHWFSFFTGSILCWIYLKALSIRYYLLFFVANLLFFLFEPSKPLGENLMVSGVFFLVIIKNRLSDLLNRPVLQYFGRISYSLYLTHWLIAGKLMDFLARKFADQMNSSLALLLMTICVSLAWLTAHFFYKWIEYPSLVFSQSFKRESQKILKAPA